MHRTFESPFLDDRLFSKESAADRSAPAWERDRFASHRLENLESPFLDEAILQSESQNEFDPSEEMLLPEDVPEQFMLESQVTGLTRRDVDDEQDLYSSERDESEDEVVEIGDEDESDDSQGEDYLREEVEYALADETFSDGEGEESLLDEGEYEEAVEFEQEDKDLAPADTVDDRAAQPAFPQTVRDRIEPLLDARGIAAAAAWNLAQHPGKSGIATATLRTRLGRYLNSSAIEAAMRGSPGLGDLSRKPDAVLAVLAHQFQQKIYTSTNRHDGKIGEGTLDALGFVRHRGDALNPVDALNQRFHVTGGSKAYSRIKDIYARNAAVFDELGSDVSPKNWYRLFVNAPFLGRPFAKGIHVELMRRLRLAEKWLLGQPRYRGMNPVELGAALGIDEDHHGGRTKNNSSMHTLGLAVDIGYVKNPWVAGQADSPTRNSYFQAVSKNVSRLLSGTEEVLTPRWLASLSTDATCTTESAYNQIQQRHTSLQVYLSLEQDPESLKTAIHRRSQGLRPELVVDRGETIDAAVRRWRGIIKSDRAKLQHAFGSNRTSGAGFLNLDRDLVIALRDHGCLAWGAIDLGASQCGDMMHFDCRATGIGWQLALKKQRTVGAGHPCSSRAEAREELEIPGSVPSLANPIDFRGGKLWAFTASALPMRVAVFCPKAITSQKNVTVLVYAHGHLAPCRPVPKAIPEDLITKSPFELGKLIDASNREIVLVVPFMDWANLTKKKLNFEACNRSTMHRLGTPVKLNGLVDEVLTEVGRVFGSAVPSLQNLILSGHSRAYDFLNPLALAHADPEMSRGALAALSHVWALDTTYVCFIAEWLRLLAAKPGLKVEVFYRKVPGTQACGEKFAAARSRSGGRLMVTEVGEGHCQVPGRRLPGLLNAAGPALTPEIGDELDHFLDEPMAAGETVEAFENEAADELSWEQERMEDWDSQAEGADRA